MLKSIKDDWCDNEEKCAVNFPAFFYLNGVAKIMWKKSALMADFTTEKVQNLLKLVKNGKAVEADGVLGLEVLHGLQNQSLI